MWIVPLLLAITWPPAQAQTNPSGRPLARFVVANAPDEVNTTLARALESLQHAQVVELELDPEDDERLLRRLSERVIVALSTEGYFSPTLRTEQDASQTARYVMHIDLGTRATIGSVDLVMQGPIESNPTRIQTLTDQWELPVGSPFRDALWSRAKTRLLIQVTEKDFAAARILESSATVDVTQAKVALKVVVASGPPFTLGPLKISGLKRYNQALVERFYSLHEGDPYDASELLAFQRRLQASVFFTSAVVTVEPDPTQSDAAPVWVELSETNRKRVQIGVGYSTNTGPRLETTYRQAMLFDHPYTLQTGLGVDQTRSIIYGDIVLPPRRTDVVDSVGGLFERSDIENVVTHRWGSGAARLKIHEREAATIETKLSINLQRELRRFTDAPDLPSETNDVLSTTWNWTRRAVDDLTDPRQGSIVSYALTAGVRREFVESLADNTFTRGWIRIKWYTPFPWLDPKHNVLILRGEAGRVFTDNPSFIPSEFLFRTGGADSLRGYAYQSIGRRPGSARAGSTALAVGSIEAVHWFGPQWGGALFFDIGDAADDFDQMREPARATGLGIRWKTLAGPVAFDFAYGQRRPDNTGGRWRLHFSVAIAF